MDILVEQSYSGRSEEIPAGQHWRWIAMQRRRFALRVQRIALRYVNGRVR